MITTGLRTFLGLWNSAAVFCIGFSCLAAPPPGGKPAPLDPRLQWWQEARFGMFIHWGPVSIKGTEIGWSRGKEVPAKEYDQLYHEFNPTRFDARAWAKTAKNAGMKYMVLTSKHHDGFCLWDTKVSDYNIMRSPFGRDVIKELSEACQKQGIIFCTYHSICDWWHRDYPMGSPGGSTAKPGPNMERYNLYLKLQLAELINNYGPLGILWFDGDWEKPWSADRGMDLYRWVRLLQPNIIINNRVGPGRAGMEGGTIPGFFGGDYDTPEQQIGKFQNQRPWESCITICQQWAWKPNDPMKSLQQCLQTLVSCAGGDGNLLFNVGPMPNGEIEPRQVERLAEMGAWLKRFGNTVYKTRGGPFMPGRWGASTHRGNKIWLHLYQLPGDEILLPPIRPRITTSKLLTGGRADVQQSSNGITVRLPKAACDPIDTIIELRLDGPADSIPPAPVTRSLAQGKPATASNVFQGMAQFGAGKAVDGDPETRWATDAGIHQASIEIELSATRTFSKIVLDEWADRVRSFELQKRQGRGWLTFHRGDIIGHNRTVQFSPVTSPALRLQILEATDGPTLNEIEIYER